MKKFSAGKFAFLCLVGLCQSSPSYAETAEKLVTWPHTVSLAFDEEVQDYDIFGKNLKTLIETGSDLTVDIQNSSSNAATLLQVDSAAATLGIVPANEIWKGYWGYNDILWGYKFDHTTSLYPIFETPFSLVTLEKNNIRTLSDLKGKTIGLVNDTPVPAQISKEILSSLALDLNFTSTDLPGTIEALEKNDILAAFIPIHHPNTLLSALEEKFDIAFLQLTDEQQTLLFENHGYLTPFKIKARSYRTDTRAIDSFALRHYLISHKNLPPTLAAHITDLSIKYKSYLKAEHKMLQYPLQEIDEQFDYLSPHPGYEMYLKESTQANLQ